MGNTARHQATTIVPKTIHCPTARQTRRVCGNTIQILRSTACHRATTNVTGTRRPGASQARPVYAMASACPQRSRMQQNAAEIRLRLSSQTAPRPPPVMATALSAGIAPQPHLRRRTLRASFATFAALGQTPTCAPPARPITFTRRAAATSVWLRVVPTVTRKAHAAVPMHVMRAATTTWTTAGRVSRKSASTQRRLRRWRRRRWQRWRGERISDVRVVAGWHLCTVADDVGDFCTRARLLIIIPYGDFKTHTPTGATVILGLGAPRRG
eukprot:4948890-Prymnesium_polylepis.2